MDVFRILRARKKKLLAEIYTYVLHKDQAIKINIYIYIYYDSIYDILPNFILR